jgi:ribonuclease HI
MGGVDLPPQGGSAPPDPANTNNRGEYRGLIALLEDYIAQGGRGPLKVRGDSQLVIRQVREEYSCRTPHLVPLLERVWALAEQIPGGVDFEWVRREQNARADAAASGGKPQEGRFRDNWANQTELGRRFGMSPAQLGRALKELGLRDQGGIATPQALEGGYCTSTPLRNGTPFFMWHIERVSRLLTDNGLVSDRTGDSKDEG